MEFSDFVGLIQFPLSFAIAGFAAYFGYILAVKKDRVAKRHEMKINYLIDAYRRLENCANRSSGGNDIHTQIESCVADIQLFGSLSQVKKAQKLAEEMSKDGTGYTHELLVDLRKDLRNELGLELSESIKYLRFVDAGKPKNN